MGGYPSSALLPGDALPGGHVEPDAVHWTAARKEEVLRRLDEGELSLNEALRRFALTVEEVEAWRAAHKVYGRRGLRIGVHRPPAQGRLL